MLEWRTRVQSFPPRSTHSCRAFLMVLAGPYLRTHAGPHASLPPKVPTPPLHPLFFFQRSGVLRIQGHHIWLQSSFMLLLGC